VEVSLFALCISSQFRITTPNFGAVYGILKKKIPFTGLLVLTGCRGNVLEISDVEVSKNKI